MAYPISFSNLCIFKNNLCYPNEMISSYRGVGCGMFFPGSICTVLNSGQKKDGSPCSAWTGAKELLNHVGERSCLFALFNYSTSFYTKWERYKNTTLKVFS